MSTTTYTLTPADALSEIDRRRSNKTAKVKKPAASAIIAAMSGADLRDLADLIDVAQHEPTPAKAESKPVPASPKKGVSTLGLTAAQTKRRAKVIAQMQAEGLPIKGDEYHRRMAEAKVPTRRTVKA